MMVISPMIMASMIRVQTPRLDKVKSKAVQQKAPDPLLINITEKGILLNNNLVESEIFLGEQIGIKLADDPERPVIVTADDNIQVGSVVTVLDLAKQRGATKLSLLKGGGGGS